MGPPNHCIPQLTFWVVIMMLSAMGLGQSLYGDPIEPQYAWTRTFGNANADFCEAVAVSPDGSVYVAGGCYGTVDFDPGPGVDEQLGEAFVTKFGPDGSYRWTRSFRVGQNHAARGAAADGQGNVFLAGTYGGQPDFDPTVGTDIVPCNTGMFTTKLGSDGSYKWTRCVPGTSTIPNYIAVDRVGNALITGAFAGTLDFNPGAGVDSHTSNGQSDIFVMKLLNNGDYGWTRTLGSVSAQPNEEGRGIAVGSNDTVVIVGRFLDSVDFDPSAGVDTHISAGSTDVFVTQYYADGSYGWTRTLGGAETDYADAVSVDRLGNVYFTGYIFGSNIDFDPTSGVDLHDTSGSFVTSLQTNGAYRWTITDLSASEGTGVAADGAGRVIVAGIVGAGIEVEGLSLGQVPEWIARITPSTPASATAQDLAVDSFDNAVIAGSFYESVDFDPSNGMDTHTSNGSRDVFVTKLRAGRGAGIPTLSGTATIVLAALVVGAGAILISRRTRPERRENGS